MTLSETLKQEAAKLRNNCEEYVAVSMLKQAGMSETDARAAVAQEIMEKEAASHLSASGIDYDEALRMVKAAGVKINSMQNYKPEPSLEESLANLLEKAASEVAPLEKAAQEKEALLQRIAELEAQIDATPQVVDVPEPITKLAERGDFTNDDLSALLSLPSATLTKVASATTQAPWKMGAGSTPASSGDPLTDWLLS